MQQYNTEQKKKIVLIINKVIQIRKKYKYGKIKIKKFLEKENIKIGTTAIETILKEHNLYNKKNKKIRKNTEENMLFISKKQVKRFKLILRSADFVICFFW